MYTGRFARERNRRAAVNRVLHSGDARRPRKGEVNASRREVGSLGRHDEVVERARALEADGGETGHRQVGHRAEHLICGDQSKIIRGKDIAGLTQRDIAFRRGKSVACKHALFGNRLCAIDRNRKRRDHSRLREGSRNSLHGQAVPCAGLRNNIRDLVCERSRHINFRT